MAKLKAHGRELARAEKEDASPAGTEVTWRRTTFSLMEDGTVLSKDDARFAPGPYDTEAERKAGGRLHSYGWKRTSVIMKTKTQEDAQQAIARFRAWAQARGFTVR